MSEEYVFKNKVKELYALLCQKEWTGGDRGAQSVP